MVLNEVDGKLVSAVLTRGAFSLGRWERPRSEVAKQLVTDVTMFQSSRLCCILSPEDTKVGYTMMAYNALAQSSEYRKTNPCISLY